MINAFKQIRLTNVNISGSEGRLEIANSGSLAFSTELQTTGTDLYNALTGLSGSLSSSTNSELTGASGALSERLLLTGSGLDAKIDTVSGDLVTYVNQQISGVIDGAPELLDTLNELAAALNNDESFATNITNLITTGIGSVESGLNALSGTFTGSLAALSGTLTSDYVTLNTTQTISGDKTFAGDVNFVGGFEVGAGEGSAALFISGTSVGINTETPSEALDVNGSARISGSLFVESGIDANNKVISNVAAPAADTDAVNLAFLTGVSGSLSSLAGGKVASATQKQFSVLLPTGIETTGIAFPGTEFTSAPTVQVTFEGDVIYQTVVKNRTVSGFDVFFSDVIQEENSYINVFASNQ
jgi:hypothetical protein